MTDEPDDTPQPDAASDASSGPQGGVEHADAAPVTPSVPGPPRPGQRVPRRATAPSPRTAPAVVVAPTPPRAKASSVVASPVRPAAVAEGEGTGRPDVTPPRPPRVRRRTRAQRPAGDAAAVLVADAEDAQDEQPTVTEPVSPTSASPSPEDAAPAAEPVLVEDATAVEGPADRASDGDAEPVPVDEEPDAETAEEPPAETAAESDADQVLGDEPGAPVPSVEHAEPVPSAERVVPARAVTVRTDSLTAPRSTRPDLPGVRETALTPSVRGDRAAAPALGDDVLVIEGLTKRFDEKVAVDDIALTVRAGSFYGIVGPNGAGKTTTMSMVTGLLRPDGGTVMVNGIDVWRDPLAAKRSIGVLPDRLRLFDRLTGAQLLHYSGALRGLDDAVIRSRSADLVEAFGLQDAVGRLVTDYSAGMAKKVALACAMIHSPRMLVLDEPFESVDPVSAANVVEILQDYVAHGGTVVLSSHGMDFIQRICDHVAIIVNGRVLAAGTMDEVRAGRSLEERFVALAGGRRTAEGFSWLHSFSD